MLLENIYESRDLLTIRNALESLLYVPDVRLKPKIITTILNRLKEKFADSNSNISVYISGNKSNTSELSGFVIVEIDPLFKSYGKPCATFGWLCANSFEACELLMTSCEDFARENGHKKIRGPINFPKGLGGMGVQVEGFDEKMLYGIAFNRREIAEYLDMLGYKRDAKYICVHVTAKTWKQGRELDENVRIGYLPLNEMISRKEDFIQLISGAFDFLLPDHSTDRAMEVAKQLAAVPGDYYKLPPNFNPADRYTFPSLLEAWNSCDLENIMIWAPLAFDRRTDELIGVIFCLPDLYQLWNGEHISRVNTDTAIIKPDYTGIGIFSSLASLVQTTIGFFGVDYVEGCYIWNKNEKAVESIFPHSHPIRRHIVFQKRLRR